MPLSPYQGNALVPGMGTAVYSAEHDLMGLIYGSPHHCIYVTHALLDGAARDTGNTDDTTVLRPGLIMAMITATQKWTPYVSGAVTGAEIPLGVLTEFGINMQLDGANADRFLATILVGGNINPAALCIAATTAYGLDKVTASHITVRKAFKYSFRFSDDFMNYTAEALAAR